MKGSKQLRKCLKRGDIAKLALKHSCSWTWAYNVVIGKTVSDEILTDAIAIAKSYGHDL